MKPAIKAPATQQSLTAELRALGVGLGDMLMVHAGLRAVGSVEGGAETVAHALLDAVGPEGTLMAMVSWCRSPYEETLNGRVMPRRVRLDWPVFDPASAEPEESYGVLNRYLLRLPDVRRTNHPDSSMAAIGARANWLLSCHPLNSAYGRRSPVERLAKGGGKVLLLGAPLDAVTVLHYAEAAARFPGKRFVRFEMPIIGPDGWKCWVRVKDFDSNGILPIFDEPGAMDGVETIARAYVDTGAGARAIVGQAPCYLFDAADITAFGIRYLEKRFGRRHGSRRRANLRGKRRVLR